MLYFETLLKSTEALVKANKANKANKTNKWLNKFL